MLGEAIKINPYYKEAYKSRGTSYMLLGEKDAAKNNFSIYESLKKQKAKESTPQNDL